jgi:SAM-dependent methyltransferase
MPRSFYDLRRPPVAPVGLPRELLDTAIFAADHAALLAQPATQALLQSDNMPIPAPVDREGYYGERHLEYWLAGLLDWQAIQPLVEGAEGPARYMDLGGSTGRVARHAARSGTIEPWVADIQISAIDWLLRHGDPAIRAFQCRPAPHLPFESGFFRAVSAFSVFTHIDSEELAWLLELRRVVAPGGLLVLTIADEATWSLLATPDWQWLRDAMTVGPDAEALRALVGQPMPQPRLVFNNTEEDSYHCNVIHSEAYVRDVWGRFLEVVDYLPMAHRHQARVVLRRR